MRTGATGSSCSSISVLRAEVQWCWTPVHHLRVHSRPCHTGVVSVRGISGCLFLCSQDSSSWPEVLKAGVLGECPTCIFTPSHDTNGFNLVFTSTFQFLLATTKISKSGNIWSKFKLSEEQTLVCGLGRNLRCKIELVEFSLLILLCESSVLCSVQYYCKNIFQRDSLKRFLKCRSSIYYIENINCKKSCNAFLSL